MIIFWPSWSRFNSLECLKKANKRNFLYIFFHFVIFSLHFFFRNNFFFLRKTCVWLKRNLYLISPWSSNKKTERISREIGESNYVTSWMKLVFLNFNRLITDRRTTLNSFLNSNPPRNCGPISMSWCRWNWKETFLLYWQ